MSLQLSRLVPRTKLRRAATLVAVAAPAVLAAVAVASAQALAPPPVTVLTSQGNIGRGDIFISPFGDTGTYANGPEIIDQKGNVVWFQPVPAGQEASDFRTQTYHGQPVLTWWQGTGLGGLATGTDYIYNNHYQQIATVNAGNGLSADGHEFLITPQNTALILSYTTATADLTSIGGPADQTVIDGVVQEIDIPTGKVLWQWNSQDHVPFGQSEQPLPASASTPWDWFHINAVHLDTDGNLLIDARDTWTTYKVNRFNGNIIWQLGGKDSSFDAAGGAGPDARQRERDLRLAARSRGDRQRRVHVLRQRVLGHAAAPLQQGDHGQAQRVEPHRDAPGLRRPARGPLGAVAGQRPDDRRGQPVRGLGGAAVLLRVQSVRPAPLQRRVPDRREHLPRLPAALESSGFRRQRPGRSRWLGRQGSLGSWAWRPGSWTWLAGLWPWSQAPPRVVDGQHRPRGRQ